jgi:hypothetical protein
MSKLVTRARCRTAPNSARTSSPQPTPRQSPRVDAARDESSWWGPTGQMQAAWSPSPPSLSRPFSRAFAGHRWQDTAAADFPAPTAASMPRFENVGVRPSHHPARLMRSVQLGDRHDDGAISPAGPHALSPASESLQRQSPDSSAGQTGEAPEPTQPRQALARLTEIKGCFDSSISTLTDAVDRARWDKGRPSVDPTGWSVWSNKQSTLRKEIGAAKTKFGELHTEYTASITDAKSDDVRQLQLDGFLEQTRSLLMGLQGKARTSLKIALNLVACLDRLPPAPAGA